MDRKTVFLISMPVIAALAVLFFLHSKKFMPPLSPAENELAGFSSGAVPVVNIRQRIIASALESPIKTPPAVQLQKREFPDMPLSQVAPAPGKTAGQVTTVQPPSYTVTLIVENGGAKRAIINGVMVKEGDMINGAKVEIIEKNKVLLTDKKEPKWIKIQ